MHKLPSDLGPAIFLQLDSDDISCASQVCKKWHELVKKIASAFCSIKNLGADYPIKTFCNYRRWTSKPALLSSSTFDNTLLKIFGLGLGELYNWILDENLDSEKLKTALLEIGDQKHPRRIFHNDQVAIPDEQVIRILNLINRQFEIITIPPAYKVDLVYYFDDYEIVFRTNKSLIRFNRSTRECVEFILPFSHSFYVLQTKNFLIFPRRSVDSCLYIMSKSTHENQRLDCSLTLYTTSNKEDLFVMYTQEDNYIKIYKDEGVQLKILHSLFFPQLNSTSIGSCFLKFYRDLLFIHQGNTLLIINPRTGALVSQLDDIIGNSHLSFSKNQLITRNIIDSYKITYRKYEFNG